MRVARIKSCEVLKNPDKVKLDIYKEPTKFYNSCEKTDLKVKYDTIKSRSKMKAVVYKSPKPAATIIY